MVALLLVEGLGEITLGGGTVQLLALCIFMPFFIKFPRPCILFMRFKCTSSIETKPTQSKIWNDPNTRSPGYIPALGAGLGGVAGTEQAARRHTASQCPHIQEEEVALDALGVLREAGTAARAGWLGDSEPAQGTC